MLVIGSPGADSIRISHPSDIAEARRRCLVLTHPAGSPDDYASRVATVVTELGTNILKHAENGRIFVRSMDDTGVQLVAADQGPGIKDVTRALQDGYSTSGTMGSGLGSVGRLSDQFTIFSDPRGTVVVAEVRHKKTLAAPSFTAGAAYIPAPGESVSGDAWAIRDLGHTVRVFLIDGLGHGPIAARPAQDALATLSELDDQSPVDAMRSIHNALRPTRGAAAALADIELSTGRAEMAGIGNISATSFSDGSSKQMISFHGILGSQLPRSFRSYEAPLGPEGRLLLHSDGVRNDWPMEPAATLHPAVVAAILLRDYRRGPDDASVAMVSLGGRS